MSYINASIPPIAADACSVKPFSFTLQMELVSCEIATHKVLSKQMEFDRLGNVWCVYEFEPLKKNRFSANKKVTCRESRISEGDFVLMSYK